MGRLDPPRKVLRGVWNIAPVVPGQTVLEIVGEFDVEVFGEGFRLKDAYVVEAVHEVTDGRTLTSTQTGKPDFAGRTIFEDLLVFRAGLPSRSCLKRQRRLEARGGIGRFTTRTAG